MSKTSIIDGRARNVNAIADSVSNISYVVKISVIGKDENCKPKTLAVQEVPFTRKSPFQARSEAFLTAFVLSVNSCTDRYMEDPQVDVIQNQKLKQERNGYHLSVSIDCINDATGERMTVNEGKFTKRPETNIWQCIEEVQWYRKSGYDTTGKTTLEVYRKKQYEILNHEII